MARPESGRELAAALTAASGQNRATGAGPHPQPETVRAGTPAVVRLIGALAHGRKLLEVRRHRGWATPRGACRNSRTTPGLQRHSIRAGSRLPQTVPAHRTQRPGAGSICPPLRRAGSSSPARAADSPPENPMLGSAGKPRSQPGPKRRLSAPRRGCYVASHSPGRLRRLPAPPARWAPPVETTSRPSAPMHSLWTSVWTARYSGAVRAKTAGTCPHWGTRNAEGAKRRCQSPWTCPQLGTGCSPASNEAMSHRTRWPCSA